MFCVYGLTDPRTQELKYVGYSSQYIERYKEHLLPSNLKSKTKKNAWLRKLLSSGLKPEIIVLEEADSEVEGLEKEVELIAYYKSIGCELTNGTLGGDGRYGFTTSQDVKDKISQSMIGKNTKPEIKSNCLYCGKEYYYKAKYLKRGHKYCSLVCANRNRYALVGIG